MSKYIKLYDAIMAMDEWFSEPITPTKILSDLPTIEVSEERQERQDAIDVLTAFTKAVEGTYEDCISRADLPKMLNGVVLDDCDKVIAPFLEEHECDELWHSVRALRDFYEWTINAPSVVPSRAEGEWLLDGRCSECLASPLTTHKNYCPNCGAKMRLE